MDEAAADFSRRVEAVLSRYYVQNGAAPPSVALQRAFAARLHAVIAGRGLPPPLGPREPGRPGGMPEAESAPLVARVLAGQNDPLLAELARQLVKACFYPEFRICRDSFRERTAEGVCRRQQVGRVRTRVSGAHCVDCPHWIEHPPQQHAALLAAQWQGDVAEFHAHREMFLPEDFRALREWLHAAARR
ncbi:MAG TPA: hypothetical protein VM029_12315 [Opitutaceae bacterium]|nr:hypothetical protein [Opitutaceae bacterium]